MPLPDDARIRACSDADAAHILEIINLAAVAYRAVIPAHRWHEPYMTSEELRGEMSSGVSFVAVDRDGELIAVMGLQHVQDAHLIRHAYVRPADQRTGVGGALIQHIISRGHRQLLVGTWADATWAIAFYQRNGFTLVENPRGEAFLRRYWTIPEAQVETSVVLARPAV